MMSGKFGWDAIERATSCQDLAARKNTIVQVIATVADPLIASMFMQRLAVVETCQGIQHRPHAL